MLFYKLLLYLLTTLQLGETPSALGNPAVSEGKIAQAVGGGGGEGGGGDDVDNDLEARLNNLRK